jgi:endonuclease/exonuclease/phosphatase (EEP) superfamily protein YafD
MKRSGMVQTLAGAILAATMLAAIPLVLGFFGSSHPALDAAGHFRAHLAAFVAIGGLVLLTSPLWKHGLLAIALGLAALSTTLSALTFAGRLNAAAGADTGQRAVYRLLHLNLLHNNPAPEKVLSLVGRVQPDVITLNEVSERWVPRLQQISAMYPYALVCDAPRRVGGVAILSRRPWAFGATGQCSGDLSFAAATIDLGGHRLEVAALHLGWPWPFDQTRQIGALRSRLAALPQTAVIAGDLNAATWSHSVRRIEGAGGLSHVPGIGPTWLSIWLPDALRPYLGLPIDQVFVKGDVTVVSATSLEEVGSDHLPVLVEFSMLGGAGSKDQAETVTAFNSMAKSD